MMTMIRLYGFDDSTSIQIALANEINGYTVVGQCACTSHKICCDFRVRNASTPRVFSNIFIFKPFLRKSEFNSFVTETENERKIYNRND